MRDPLERSPEMPRQPHDPVPPMPVNLPTEDTDNPHSTPLRHDVEDQPIEPHRPPEPENDANPEDR
ncbi:hypothetical protein O9Z70_07325 [Devosia sp. YIM 151766]|uniref:hypothetical protein n=1 Tax=Devosia sp. YIM 151766 TaxID=3017325 RepID=UPI00255CF1A0|nr:hypothetical protein [Devosia sp. YIM 151766]WIY54318.1 hypothetical protein O9Z70_07325 [Devosia sp. YIM 151766]